ncbi:MAG: SDR family oxidoreductase [Deltaproteobacteria bacterium]|jgi:NAD(P)-dependent dehydrogenase (short-subunit alcohol dehydrogenase family)|nr:SDR family oxidoreductase [Deltaproteobacteria bacterium]
MDMSYRGKVAIVTGAAEGMGFSTAKAFAEAGASVVLADIQADKARAAAETLTNAGLAAIGIPCDVSREDQVAAMVNQTVETYGRLDASYNNAGIQTPQVLAADMRYDDYDKTMAVNLRGIFTCMKYEIAAMLKNGGGAIVNCSSQGGLTGFPGQAAYIASKHGVIGLTRTAALDYAQKGVRINAICPGVIRTPMAERLLNGNKEAEAAITKMIPLGRLGTGEEIASAVLWLCSPGASFVIGHALIVDGGFTVQ